MQRCLDEYSASQAAAAVDRSIEKNERECSVEESSLYLCCGNRSKPERLCLPRRRDRSGIGGLDVDEYLSRIPRVVGRIDELSQEAANEHFYADTASHSRRRCLNVLQGEVAHATSLQADILVSSEATTCHVVALRSTTCSDDASKAAAPPLCSLAHVDMVNDACLENILKEHLEYHDRRNHIDYTSLDVSNRTQDTSRVFVSGGRSPAVDDSFGFFADDDDMGASTHESTTSRGFLPSWVEPPSNLQTTARVRPPPQKTAMIEIDLHMVGGFLDTQGASKRLSAALIERFDALARKYSDRVRIYLVTAAISCLNHNQSMSRTRLSRSSSETAGPVHRGLGIDTHTGRVFSVPCSLPPQWAGPAVELRSARRVFGDEPTLAVIHTADSEHIRVEPFCYTPDPKLNVLLHVPDSILLDVTSTSPRHESDNFCSNFRRTLSFINAVPPDTVFGHGARKRPLVYTRSAANLHEWIIADAVPSERMLCRSLAG